MENEQRLTVADAATLLGISQGAIRKRIARGTLPHRKDEDGRVWVLLDADTPRDTLGQDAGQDTGYSQLEVLASSYRELIEELRDRVRSLEAANAENRRIIAAITSRIPQLEAPLRPDEAPEGQDTGQYAAGPEEPSRDRRGEETCGG